MGEKCRFYVDIIAQHPEVTGSCFLLVIKDPAEKKTIKGIIDCGLFQERRYEHLNQQLTFNADEVSFVLLTHAHMDHIGRVPKMVKEGYKAYVYCTKDTYTLMPEALINGHKVMQKNAKLRHQSNLVLYDENHIEETIKRTCPIEYNKTYQVHENVKVTFLPNAHLVGAAMIFVEIHDYQGNYINLLFTGDYNANNTFLPKSDIPQEILKKPLTIVTESTYGLIDSCEDDENKVFEHNVVKAIMENKEVLIPAFALGRSQEVLYRLKIMQEKGKIPLGVPIYLDGNLAMQYTDFYRKGALALKPEMIDFLPSNFEYVTSERMRTRLLNDNNRKIIVTTSGMGKHGPAQLYIPYALEKTRAMIHFTGYCAEGTYGRILQDTAHEEEIMLGGLLITKKAEVNFTTEFSSHAKADELMDLLGKFENTLSVVVNHGRTESKQTLAKRLRVNLKVKKIGVIDNSTVFRIGPYGIVKTITIFDK